MNAQGAQRRNSQPWNKGLRVMPYWRSRKWLPVDPSNREVQRTFRTGQCHSLAFALHKLTGWPLVVLCDDLDNIGRSWAHVVVMHPSGMFVDIDGAWNIDDNSRWGYYRDSEPFDSIEDVLAEIAGTGDTVAIEQARPFAEAVLSNIRTPA